MLRDNPKQLIKILAIVLAIVIVVIYAIARTRSLAKGPVIEITEPLSGETSNQAMIDISGSSKNTSLIHLNGAPIFVDEQGFFEEKLLLLPGYNIIQIEAWDRFEKYDSETLELYYESDSEPVEIPQESSVEILEE